MLLEMCEVQSPQSKSVFTFQRTKVLVFTTIKSANPVPKCRLFILRTKNQKFCSLVVMVQIDILVGNDDELQL